MVDDFILEYETNKAGYKTVAVSATLMNGFELAETHTFNSPDDYDEELGEKICREAIENKVRDYLGFLVWTAAMLAWDERDRK